MYTKRLMEIAEERKAFLEELNGEVTEERMAEIEARNTELDKEEKQIRMKMDLEGNLDVPEDKPEERGNDAEKVYRDAKESGHLEIRAAEVKAAIETRSTLIATDSLAKPTRVGTDIHDTLQSVSSIIDQVSIVDLTGCQAFEEPYVKTEMSAGTRDDGAANGSPSDPVFRVARLNPYLVNVTSYVSKNIERLTPINYYAKVRELALKALRVKVTDLIVNGAGGTFFGIKIAKNTKNEAICKKLELSSASFAPSLLNDIVFSYGGDDSLGGNARLFLTKEDLQAFGNIRGTNEKKKLFEIIPDPSNPNTGTIKDGGMIVPYTICSKLTSLSTAVAGDTEIPTMIYGDPRNFELGLFGPYNVEVSKDYKFAEGLLTIMGELMAGGNVIVHEGFVIVTLKSTLSI
ncbi:MAG: phage major capsid protein [Lachnospiraceae bacterium]|nr:phage major capsid protein [Lachnospiraceae bacterium]